MDRLNIERFFVMICQSVLVPVVHSLFHRFWYFQQAVEGDIKDGQVTHERVTTNKRDPVVSRGCDVREKETYPE